MRSLALAAVLAAIGLSASAGTPQKPDAGQSPAPSPVSLDCSRGYAALAAAIAAQPGITHQAPVSGPDLYQGKGVTYFVSKPGMTGHPAIVELTFRDAAGALVAQTTHCGYGDPQGTDDFLYLVNGLLKSMGALETSPPG